MKFIPFVRFHQNCVADILPRSPILALRMFYKEQFQVLSIRLTGMLLVLGSVYSASYGQTKLASDSVVDSSAQSNPLEISSVSTESRQDDSVSTATNAKSGAIKFAFDRANWREVFSWLADEAGLALHISEIPGGTFTYSDPTEYTTTSAIDRINMFLLPDGFSLVRSKGLLSVINLRDARSLQRLDAMARIVKPEELETLDDHEVVKCFFSFGDLRSVDASGELVRLQLMATPIVMEASKQVLVIETARKLRSVQKVLLDMQKEIAGRQSLVRPFVLKHVNLEALLTVARPHLGIDPGLSRSPEINISSDESGKRLFVSGTYEAIKLFESLIEIVDVEEAAATEKTHNQSLRSHRVRDQNLTTVFEVLQTVLTGKSIRLSMEPSTNSIVALGDEAVHKTIESTIAELEGLESIFTIIPLQSIDPYFAITLLDEMFDLKLPANLTSKRSIKVDADPSGMRLFVRGPKDKVEEIKKVVEELDMKGQKGSERIIPVFGPKAKSVLDQAGSSWQGKNPIRQDDRTNEVETEIIERSIHSDSEDAPNAEEPEQPTPTISSDSKSRSGEFVSARGEVVGKKISDAISAKITSRGIVLESSDVKALDSFELLLRSLAAEDEASKVETIVYYLKYCTADEATYLIADLLDGTSSVLESTSTSKLVKGSVPNGKGSGVPTPDVRSTKDGSTLVTSGTLTVIADARLNRLICVGNSSDLQLVEQYLSVIDKDTSLTAIEVHGVSHIIELHHAKASDIADVIRDTYGDRVAMSTEQKKAQQAERTAKDKEGAGPEKIIQTSRNQEPQMSIAVHEVSNSIVVTAPDALFQDIKQLIERLDKQSEQTVEVIYYPSSEGIEMLREALQLKGSPAKPRATKKPANP